MFYYQKKFLPNIIKASNLTFSTPKKNLSLNKLPHCSPRKTETYSDYTHRTSAFFKHLQLASIFSLSNFQLCNASREYYLLVLSIMDLKSFLTKISLHCATGFFFLNGNWIIDLLMSFFSLLNVAYPSHILGTFPHLCIIRLIPNPLP